MCGKHAPPEMCEVCMETVGLPRGLYFLAAVGSTWVEPSVRCSFITGLHLLYDLVHIASKVYVSVSKMTRFNTSTIADNSIKY